MATPYHTGAKGDNLLGSIVAKELLKVGLVEQIGQAPWIHPLENKKEDYDLKYRDISLKQFEFNRVFFIFNLDKNPNAPNNSLVASSLYNSTFLAS